jgi:hypothetical protein
MPRDPNQVFIGAFLDRELVFALDSGRGSLSRSAFVREALVEKLQRCGVRVRAGISDAPDRTGKGGRPRKAAAGALEGLPVAAEDAAEYKVKPAGRGNTDATD